MEKEPGEVTPQPAHREFYEVGPYLIEACYAGSAVEQLSPLSVATQNLNKSVEGGFSVAGYFPVYLRS